MFVKVIIRTNRRQQLWRFLVALEVTLPLAVGFCAGPHLLGVTIGVVPAPERAESLVNAFDVLDAIEAAPRSTSRFRADTRSQDAAVHGICSGDVVVQGSRIERPVVIASTRSKENVIVEMRVTQTIDAVRKAGDVTDGCW